MKNILTSLVLLLAVNLQAQTITVDGTPMLVSSDTSFPFWLQSGSSISPETPVSSISILEFNIVSNANGNDMVFNQVLSVSSIATVPEGKTWKVESVLQENQSFEVSNANSSLFIPTNSSSTNIVIEEASLSFSQATISASILPSGGSVISERGFCYSYSNPQPTVYDNLTILGSSTGSFENDYPFYLMEDTVMYVRAFATNIEGITYSDVITFVSPSVYIGQELEGGIVFYIDETGQHGLVAALEDLGQFEWGCYGTSISGADGTSIGSGLQNTMDITNRGCQTGNGGITAAQAALDADIESHTDWYLPSRDELKEMYNTIGNGSPVGNIGGFSSSWYWSSSEVNNTNVAWLVTFDDGHSSFDGKNDAFRVRVIRAF